jgi:hypothetical protein
MPLRETVVVEDSAAATVVSTSDDSGMVVGRSELSGAPGTSDSGVGMVESCWAGISSIELHAPNSAVTVNTAIASCRS